MRSDKQRGGDTGLAHEDEDKMDEIEEEGKKKERERVCMEGVGEL